MNKRGRVARTPIELAAVGGLTRGKDPTGSGGYRMIILQIIGGKFGGMENSLYLCSQKMERIWKLQHFHRIK